VLVAGGAKYCPTTSAQLESLFTGLTRQQGASKLHISQQQIGFEARSPKNSTMGALTVGSLRAGWEEAKAVKKVLDAKGFWSCDVTVAANRKFMQKQNEEMEVQEAGGDDDDDGVAAEPTWEVERIISSTKPRGKERMYRIKWKDYPPSTNSDEPEQHLLT